VWRGSFKAALTVSTGFTNDGEDPSVRSGTLNIGYADHLQHQYWHYIDFRLRTRDASDPAKGAQC
jgi:hypothetical protein